MTKTSRWNAPEPVVIAALTIGTTVALVGAQLAVLASDGHGDGRRVDALAVVLAVLATAPVVVARRAPFASVAAIAVGVVGFTLRGYDAYVANATAMIPALAALSQRPRRAAIVPAAVAAGLIGYGGTVPEMNFGWTCVVVFVPFLAALGSELRRTLETTQRTLDGIVEDDIRHDQTMLAMLERSRAAIARDVHDIISHSISVILAQATLGRRAARGDPNEAYEALATVEHLSETALGEIRRLSSDDDERAAGGHDGSECDVDALVERIGELVGLARRSGHQVAIVGPAGPAPVPPPVADAAYRLVQEALTNVRRHAPGADIDIALRVDADELTVSVHNGPAQREATDFESGGFGLRGMIERIEALGGSFSADDLVDGGFDVSARVPLTSWHHRSASLESPPGTAPDQPDEGPRPTRRSVMRTWRRTLGGAPLQSVVIAACGCFSLLAALAMADADWPWMLVGLPVFVAIVLSSHAPTASFVMMLGAVAALSTLGWGHYYLILFVLALVPAVRLAAAREFGTLTVAVVALSAAFWLVADGESRAEEVTVLAQGFWILVICLQIGWELHSTRDAARAWRFEAAEAELRTRTALSDQRAEIELELRSSIERTLSDIRTMAADVVVSSDAGTIEQVLAEIETYARVASTELRATVTRLRDEPPAVEIVKARRSDVPLVAR